MCAACSNDNVFCIFQETRGKLGLESTGGSLFAVGGVSGFRETDQLNSIER